MRRSAVAIALILMAAAWVAALTLHTFAAHMAAHVAVVAVAAPLLAIGLSWRPRALAAPMSPLVACAAELVVVWGWHVPWLHGAAREHLGVFVLEQASFLAAGYAVWASAVPVAGEETGVGGRRLAGVGALLMTSMHMSLLGGLLAVSSGAWYHADASGALWDQQLGGVIMLGVGGLAYLTGALILLGRALGREPVLEDSP